MRFIIRVSSTAATAAACLLIRSSVVAPHVRDVLCDPRKSLVRQLAPWLENRELVHQPLLVQPPASRESHMALNLLPDRPSGRLTFRHRTIASDVLRFIRV